MYRVLIVDDETAHRKGMIQLLNTIRPDYFLLEAKDGVMAELILDTMEVDIILTDIRMPNKDGLEFLQDLYNVNHRAKVIIISGYGQFEYAKRALSMGAFDFFLKPIDMGELAAALDRAERSIQESNLARITQSLGIDLLLGKLVRGTLTAQEAAQLDGIIPRELPGFVYAVSPPKVDTEVAVDKLAFKQLLKEQWEPYGHSILFEMLDSNTASIGMVFLTCELQEAPSTLVQSLATVQEALPYGCKMGISSCFSPLLSGCAEAYVQASNALSMTFYTHDAALVFSPQESEEIQLLKLLNERETHLSRAIRYSDHFGVTEELAQIFSKIECSRNTNPTRLKELFLIISLRLVYFLQGTGGVADYQPTIVKYNQQITDADSLYNMRIVVEELCLLLNDVARQNDKSEDAITLTLQYLDAHYNEDIGLATLAEKLYFTPSYFSIYFKKKTGQNFNQYLTALRMEKACTMLCDTQLKISDISLRVGYADSAYFGKAFKKKMGCSPEEYRKRNYVL